MALESVVWPVATDSASHSSRGAACYALRSEATFSPGGGYGSRGQKSAQSGPGTFGSLDQQCLPPRT
eukprot:2920035-Pyramimonas_sp.AAC.1